jgi:hypothetical protein
MAFTTTGVILEARGLASFQSALKSAQKSITDTGKASKGLASDINSFGKGVLKGGALLGGVALAGLGAFTTGVATLGVTAVNTSISVQSAFAGVTKTVNGLTTATGELSEAGENLKRGFQDLALEIPVAVEELMGIGELGGQLGVQEDNLLNFTKTIAQLGVTTDLTSEAAATSLAQLMNIMGSSQDSIGSIGNVIVALGNNSATTESQIVNFAQRIAGAGKIAGLTEAQVLGIAASFSSVGIEAEAGGTATQKVLLAMQQAVAGSTTGFVDNSAAITDNVDRLSGYNAKLVTLEARTGMSGDALWAQYQAFLDAGGAAEDWGRQLGDTNRNQLFNTIKSVKETEAALEDLRASQGKPIDPGQLTKFAEVAGMTADDFQTLWKEDSSKAFEAFVTGLGAQGDEAINTLEDLGLSDQRLIRSFLSLSNNSDILTSSLELANNEFENGNALAKEAEQRFATTASRIQLLKNQVRDIGITIGDTLLPAFNNALAAASDFALEFGKKLPGYIEDVKSAWQGFKTVWQGFNTGEFDLIKGGFQDIREALKGLGLPEGLANTIVNVTEKVYYLKEAAKGLKDLFVGLIDKDAFQIDVGLGGLMAAFEGLGLDPDIALQIAQITSDLVTLGQEAFTFFQAFGEEHWSEIVGAIAGVGAVLAGSAIFAVLTAIGTAIAALATPMTLIIGAAALLGAAWAGNWFGIQDIVMGAWEAIQPMLVELWTWLSTNIPAALATLSQWWTENWPILAAVALTVWTVIRDAIMTAVSVITASVIPAFQTAFANLQEAFSQTGVSWGDVWEGIKTVLIAAGVVILGIIATIIGVITAFATGFAQALTYVSEVWILLVSAVQLAVEGIINIVSGIGTIIAGILEGDFTMIGEGLVQLFEGIVQTLVGIIGVVAGIITAALAGVIGFIQGFVTGIIEYFQTLYDTLVGNSIIPDLVTGIIGWFEMLIDPITGVFETIISTVTDAFGTIGDLVTSIPGIGAIFGGGEEEAPVDGAEGGMEGGALLGGFDSTAIVEALETTLPEAFATFGEVFLELWTPVQEAILLFQTTLLLIATETLVLLTEAFSTFATIAIQQLTTLTTFILSKVVGALTITLQVLMTLQSTTVSVTETMVESFEHVTDEIKVLIEAVDELIEQLEAAARAARNVTAGVLSTGADVEGAKDNVGLQHGAHFIVPPGYPNDSFGPVFLTSGEEVIVRTPSQQGVGGGTTNMIEVNINNPTVRNDRDLDTMRLMVRQEISDAIGVGQ